MRSCTRTWAFRASTLRCASTAGGRGCAEGRRTGGSSCRTRPRPFSRLSPLPQSSFTAPPGPFVVSHAPRAVLAACALAAIVFAAALGTFLRSKTDAALPLWDAGTTAFSLVAQFLQTRKWIENWPIWIAVDTIYVGMYVLKRLY